MQTSRPIQVQGRFLGVAITLAEHWRFIATDPAVEALHGEVFPSLAEAERMLQQALARAQAAPARPIWGVEMRRGMVGGDGAT